MHKPDNGIPRCRSRLSVFIKVGMLDDALEMSVD